jgi:hypothetical protein
MGSPALLLCRRCSVLHPLPTRAADDDALDDLASFRAAHEAHGLVGTERVAEPALFDGATADPMSARWFRVAIGNEVLLVHSWRTSVDEPRRFELSTGSPATMDCIEVDEPLLRRALDRHFYPQAIRAAKVERIVAVLRSVVGRLDAHDIEIAFDDPAFPNAVIGPLPDGLDQEVVGGCAAFLDAWELDRLRTFVAEHRGADGALGIRVRRLLDRSAA